MGKKNKSSDLGRTLIKDRFGSSNKARRTKDPTLLHTAEINDGYDWGRLNLQSVTEESSFREFLSTAELAGTEFQAEKLNITFVNPKCGVGLLSADAKALLIDEQEKNKWLLGIPRRPPWDTNTTAEELQAAEQEHFLNWRRRLAQLQEVKGLLLTPYEKNLEFWRQLWRVVERSDVVVQIVDARNPVLFRCEDLERYVKEVGSSKVNLLLINKADFLKPEQRRAWADYFDKQGVRVAFFSATETANEDASVDKSDGECETGDSENETALDEKGETVHEPDKTALGNIESDGGLNDYVSEVDDINSGVDEGTLNEVSGDLSNVSLLTKAKSDSEANNSTVEEIHKLANELDNLLAEEAGSHLHNEASTSGLNRDHSFHELDKNKPADSGSDGTSQTVSFINCADILTREELISLFRGLHTGTKVTAGITTIGLVGYPNVGKSSTINSLLTHKKVSVSATPGKTKHFQTLFLEEDLLLCDCPGLVMPSFVLTKAEMVVNGILPIDQMRDHVPPVTLVASLMPRHVLEDTYGLMLPPPTEDEDPSRPPTSEELLGTYGLSRGFMTQNGQPDASRSARYILKDFVKGRLLYCHGPPGMEQEQYHHFPERQREARGKNAVLLGHRLLKPNQVSAKDVDQTFFQKVSKGVHKKGIVPVGTSHPTGMDGSSAGSPTHAVSKPWRDHGHKRNKHQKLRKVYAHLDQ